MVRDVCDEDVRGKISEIFGLDDEGESKGLFKDIGLPGLWIMMGKCMSISLSSMQN
jgi:hypothetical protein